MRSLREIDPEAQFTFLGGDEMTAAASESAQGSAPLIHYRDMAFMAFSEVLRHLGKIFGNLKKAKNAISEDRPEYVHHQSHSIQCRELPSSMACKKHPALLPESAQHTPL